MKLRRLWSGVRKAAGRQGWRPKHEGLQTMADNEFRKVLAQKSPELMEVLRIGNILDNAVNAIAELKRDYDALEVRMHRDHAELQKQIAELRTSREDRDRKFLWTLISILVAVSMTLGGVVWGLLSQQVFGFVP